jgi:hypothetical protein
MMPADDDLFKPLSARVGRKHLSSGGREKTGGMKRSGDANRVLKAMARRVKDAQRAKAVRG